MSDLEKAQRIVAKRERWVGAHGALRENVADAVAEGIALGRKEGLELAARAVTAGRAAGGSPDRHPSNFPEIRMRTHKRSRRLAGWEFWVNLSTLALGLATAIVQFARAVN
jgi:hypothetical protein